MEFLTPIDQTLISKVRGKDYVYNVKLKNTHKGERDLFFKELTIYLKKQFKGEITDEKQVRAKWKGFRDEYARGVKAFNKKQTLSGRRRHIRKACFDFLEVYMNVEPADIAVPQSSNSLATNSFSNDPEASSAKSPSPPSNFSQPPVQQTEPPEAVLLSHPERPETPCIQQQQQQQHFSAHQEPPREPDIPQATLSTASQKLQSPHHQPLRASGLQKQKSTMQSDTASTDDLLLSMNFQPSRESTPLNRQSAVPFAFRLPKSLSRSLQQVRQTEHPNKSISDELNESSGKDSESSESDDEERVRTRKSQMFAKKRHPNTVTQQSSDMVDLHLVLQQLRDCITRKQSSKNVRAHAKILCNFIDKLEAAKQILAIQRVIKIFKKYHLKNKRLRVSATSPTASP